MIVRVKEFKGYGLLYYLDDEDEVYSDESVSYTHLVYSFTGEEQAHHSGWRVCIERSSKNVP